MPKPRPSAAQPPTTEDKPKPASSVRIRPYIAAAILADAPEGAELSHLVNTMLAQMKGLPPPPTPREVMGNAAKHLRKNDRGRYSKPLGSDKDTA